MGTTTIDGIDWDFILETIKNEKCILFIGPEIFKNDQGHSLEDQVADYIKVGTNSDIQSFYPKDGLFLFTSGTKKTKSYYKLKSFFNQDFQQASNIYNKLAQIPFHFIISITPDNLCYNTFQKEGMKINQDFYWKKQPSNTNLKTPNRKNPLIYNMFGSIEQQESMVLTHDDLFDYFESIFKENSMPEKLKLNIKNADNFIFLGLDFEKWYMQLLLRILYLHNDQYEFMRYAANQHIDEKIKTFCFQQFKIEFIPSKINGFVDSLYEKCVSRDLIRTKGEQQESPIEQFTNWLSADKVDEALQGFKAFLEDLGEKGMELLEDLTLLISKHRRLQRKVNEDIIRVDDATIEDNKIRRSLLDLLKEARAFE